MRVVLCNCPPHEAASLARALVESKLAACVNVIAGVKSWYCWEGKLVEDDEVTLLIKTAAERVDALRGAIVDRHPYSVPEVVVLPVDVEASHPAYVRWVREEVA